VVLRLRASVTASLELWYAGGQRSGLIWAGYSLVQDREVNLSRAVPIRTASRSLGSTMSTRESSRRGKVDILISEGWCDESPDSVLPEVSSRKPALLGLACARRRAYYEATLDYCPICGCRERVSPQACGPIIHARSRAA